MEEHSLEPFAVNCECTCNCFHSPMHLVNSEHTSDCVFFWGVPVAEKSVNKRPKNQRKESSNGESEWRLLRPED